MATTKGFSCSVADAITIGTTFTDPNTAAPNPNPIVSSYIIVPTGGTEGGMVYRNGQGVLMWCAYAFVGYNPIAATAIVASGVVNGVMRTTVAVPTGYIGEYVG